MENKVIWEELNSIPEPLTDYTNDTDLSIEILMKMAWQLSGTERSKYSTSWVDTYVEPTGKYAKKVFSDGFVEFYELA
jgi:hypothetical protein